MNFGLIEHELIQSRPLMLSFSPGAADLVVAKELKTAVRVGMTIWKSWKIARAAQEGKLSTFVGSYIGSAAVRQIAKPVKTQVKKAHVHVATHPHDPFRKNGMGGRSWITKPGRYPMVIVFHDANRAGPHVDVHIGRFSVIYRVKPHIYEQLRYNREGYLTEDSQKLLMEFVRSEINNGSRLPQNLDHSLSNARSSWVNGDVEGKNYGDGRTRQVISVTEVDVYKAAVGHPIELYAPVLNPHRPMYIHGLYGGTKTRAPILVWGNFKHQPPKLEDRLHLKLMHPEVLEDDLPITKVDWSTATAKYDGSSAYIVITKDGTTVWSPRQSVKTGEQIEYTHKLDGVAQIKSDGDTIVAMGEVLFREKSWNPWKKNAYLPSATGSGILNTSGVLPKNIEPEIRLYRVDRVGRTRTKDMDFWENRQLQEQTAALSPQLQVVELMTPDEAAALGYEGVVAVPLGASVNDGVKIKWWTDPHDWRIDKVAFTTGPKGGMAGVVYATSLDSGKQFKLGPGQVGDRALTEQMMAEPEKYEGTVLKVQSRHGHEGRASKVVAVHSDKGFAPI